MEEKEIPNGMCLYNVHKKLIDATFILLYPFFSFSSHPNEYAYLQLQELGFQQQTTESNRAKYRKGNHGFLSLGMTPIRV